MVQCSKITAHSGCDGTPDNSREFLAYAMQLPVDCVEVDVRRSPDDRLILAHDEGEARGLLEDAFRELANFPTKKINCDLKQEKLEIPVFRLAESFGVQTQLIYSGCVSEAAAQEHPGLFGIVDWYLNIELVFPQIYYDPGHAIALDYISASRMACQLQVYVERVGAKCVNAHYDIERTLLYPRLLDRKIPCSVWTPNEEGVIRRFLEDRVYNITTRNAARACEMAQGTAALERVQ